ncbi:MAG TPA: TetR/AcrR family transcriptional regulator [Acidimicrobiales bacterium]|nr:TetR/AcrR family transcriptional regulator [Acidimicrobiales bacterium]
MAQEPLTERGRRSRERIIEAAAAAVAERGAGGCSLDQVLEAAGASKSQLYHYFADKDDLVRAVIARRVGETLDCQGPMLSELDSFADIRRWFDWLIAQNEKLGCPGCPLGTLANELADRDETARVDLAGGFDTWMSYVIEGLARMQARGELVEQADPQRLGHAVFASLQGGLLLSKTTKVPQYLRDALDASYAHLLSFAPPGPS